MENNNNKILVTDGYKVAHDKMINKLMLNTYFPTAGSPYIVFHDPAVAERIAEEAYIQTRAIQSIADNLIVVSHGREKFLHHVMPTSLPFSALLHDTLEAQIGDYPKLSEKIIEKNLQLSNIVVSLQGNNQKD